MKWPGTGHTLALWLPQPWYGFLELGLVIYADWWIEDDKLPYELLCPRQSLNHNVLQDELSRLWLA